MEFAVLIHVLPLVVGTLGHEVSVVPHLGKNPPIFDKDVGHLATNVLPSLKPSLCFSLETRTSTRLSCWNSRGDFSDGGLGGFLDGNSKHVLSVAHWLLGVYVGCDGAAETRPQEFSHS